MPTGCTLDGSGGRSKNILDKNVHNLVQCFGLLHFMLLDLSVLSQNSFLTRSTDCPKCSLRDCQLDCKDD